MAELTPQMERASAWVSYMMSYKGTLSDSPQRREKVEERIAASRERYATGRISLGQFEVEVTRWIGEAEWPT